MVRYNYRDGFPRKYYLVRILICCGRRGAGLAVFLNIYIKKKKKTLRLRTYTPTITRL